MLEGMYSAAAGMAAQQQRLDALSNDLANLNTAGYKGVRVAFRDLLYTPSGPGGAPGVESGAGAAAVSLGRGSAQGALQQTGNPFDVAIEGPGFLQVRDARGRLALTRDGALQRRADGQLATSAGALVGVRIPQNVADSDVAIAPNGVVRAGGQVVGRLRLVTVTAPDRLRPAGDNLFVPTRDSGGPIPAGADTQVQQRALEASNVDMADAMTSLMDAQRAFALASKAVTTQDQLLEIANGVKK